MMGSVSRCDAIVPTLLLLLFAACKGEGSDIGPRLARLPDASSKVLLLDDQNRGVVSGSVSVVGSEIQALTGRNGRGDFLASPGGAIIVQADGSGGAATSGDTLAPLEIAMTVSGQDLPIPIHLPNLSDDPGAGAGLPSGLQLVTTTLATPEGSIVTIMAGVSILNVGAPNPVVIRLGELSPEHLPGDLPISSMGGRLFGRGIYVEPADALFTPGLDIDVVDDLSLDPGSAAQLYRLDSNTGQWVSVAVGLESSGRIAVNGVLTHGGLYAFSVATTGMTVTGRVLDTSEDPVKDAMIRVDGRQAWTDGNGEFFAEFVPATNGDGSQRSATIEVFAGGQWLPAISETEHLIPLPPPALNTTDVGVLELDTVLAGNVRVQQVVRARADPYQPARLSSMDGGVSLFTTSDGAGQVLFEDVPGGYFGFQEGRQRDTRDAFYGQGVGFLTRGRRWLNNYQFLYDRRWFIGTNSTRCYVSDSIGGGPIYGATVIKGSDPVDGYVDQTRENGFVYASRLFGERATATARTSRDGMSITHAFTYQEPYSDHLEFPLQRVLRQPLGAFDRHGLVAGTLIGVTPATEHGLRVTRRITRQQWWDDLVDGVPLQSSLPIDIDPKDTHGSYQAGISASGGHLSAIEYTTAGGANTLQRVGLLTDYQPVEGQVTMVDVPLEYEANTAFVATEAALGVDPAVDLNDLDVALGLELANGHFVDVAPDVSGSYAINGDDLELTLPPLDGELDGGQWVALLQGESIDAGVTSSHASILALAAPSTTDFVFPEFPVLITPTPDAEVPASGFTTTFTLPAGAFAGAVELRSIDDPDELLLWQVILRADRTNFAFVELPTQAETPLIPGREYTLTITAWFGTIDIDRSPTWEYAVPFAQSIGLVEAGLTQIARRSITITTF